MNRLAGFYRGLPPELHKYGGPLKPGPNY